MSPLMYASIWETANGVLALLGAFLTTMILIYLIQNYKVVYREPIRFITIMFAFIIVGHTMKDASSYLARCCNVTVSPWFIGAATFIVAIGKLGCIQIWTHPRWGAWPWVTALSFVILFLFINQVLGETYAP